ncbi:MAG TPA: TVP38/TMEM64 family protein [Caulobacteraceae bacterium]
MTSERAMALLKRFGPLIVLVAAVIWAVASGATDRISLAELKARHAELSVFVHTHWWTALATFMAIYIAVVALSLPLALVMTLSGGFLFGPVVGALASLSSATVGSTITFLACRTAFGDMIARHSGQGLGRLIRGFHHNAFAFLFTLRIIPLAPVALINIGAGLAGVSVATFMTASFIGMAPGSFVYAFLGAGLGSVFERGEEPNLRIIFEPQVLIPLIGLAALAMAPVVYRRVRRKPA